MHSSTAALCFGMVFSLFINFAVNDSNEEDDSKSDFEETALDVTNKLRSMHNADPLTLDPTLSRDCQVWAEYLAEYNYLQHSCHTCSDYGENLWMQSGEILSTSDSAQQAIESWYGEVSIYDWDNPGYSQSTGHFTALVWKASTAMGIGIAKNYETKSTYVVVRYTPAGNIIGAFEENV